MINGSVPPRFVPTLTEIVPPDALLDLPELSGLTGLPAIPVLSGIPVNALKPVPFSPIEAQLVNRVMQRVDLVLEQRLRDAVSELILSHTQALSSRLREEIAIVVQESVSQAMAQELNPPG